MKLTANLTGMKTVYVRGQKAEVKKSMTLQQMHGTGWML